MKDKGIEVPEWEHTAAANSHDGHSRLRATRASFESKIDSILPPHRRYLGLTRKAFLWIVLVVCLVLVALIIGLAAGLSQQSR